MTGINRTLGTLVGAAAAGCLLWAAAQVDRGSNGGYWAAYAIVAGAGIVFAISQLRRRDGSPLAMIGLAFVPVLVVVAWVLVALEPNPGWLRDHVLAWSSDIGIGGVVRDVGTWIGVLAFGTGLVLGQALEPVTTRRRARTGKVVTRPGSPSEAYTLPPAPTGGMRAAADRTPSAADEPVTAERRAEEETEVAHRA